MPPKRKTKKSKANKKAVNLHDFASVYEEPPIEEYLMLIPDNREKSFQDWPLNEKSSCNPKSLAEAGFYHIPTKEAPDATRCFACFKELDGWEEDDDPWAEHTKHSPKCYYLKLGKKMPDQLTVQELIELETERRVAYMNKYFHVQLEEVIALMEHSRNQLTGLNPQ